MPKIPTPEVAAKRKSKAMRSRFTNRIREALANGNEPEAYRLCKVAGLDIFEARLAPEYNSPAEPWFVAKGAENKALEAEQQANMVNAADKAPFTPTIEIKAPSVDSSLFSTAVVEASGVPLEGQDVIFPIAVVENPILDVPEPVSEQEAQMNDDVRVPHVEPKRTESVVMVRGWPCFTEAVVWGIPRNPNLVIILLPDQRKASCFQSRHRKLKIHDKVQVKLEQAFIDGEKMGDPIFEDISKKSSIW